jgi:integrase
MSGSIWKRTGVQNLVKNGESGIYYARVMVSGKPKWRSLDTKAVSVAKLRLPEVLRVLRAAWSRAPVGGEVEAMGSLVVDWLREVELGSNSPAGKRSLSFALKRVLATWPGFEALRVERVSVADCEAWLRSFKRSGSGFVPPGSRGRVGVRAPSASAVNKSIDALRSLFDLAVRRGLRAENPARGLQRVRVSRNKEFYVPSVVELEGLLREIRRGSNVRGPELAALAEFMAWTGTGPDEASRVCGRDVFFDKELLRIRGTKSAARDRWLPMNRPVLLLLKRLRDERVRLVAGEPLFRYRTFQRSLDRACAVVGIPRLTHYDLRHFFCTRCLECGVQIPVLAAWMGHSDGGALLLRTYAHVRNEHGAEQAGLVG